MSHKLNWFTGGTPPAPPLSNVNLAPAISGPVGGPIKFDLAGVARPAGLVTKVFRFPDYRTPVSVLTGCRARQGQTRLSDIGSGQMTISNSHADRATIESDDLIRYELEGEAIHSWFVGESKSATATSDQNTPVTQETVFSGPDVLGVLGEGLVWPPRGADVLPVCDDRIWSWPSFDYNDAWWGNAVVYCTIDEANAGHVWPIPLGGTTPFPSPDAGVIGPPEGDPTIAPPGDWYVRKVITVGASRYNFYITVDNTAEFYIDGQQFAALTDLGGVAVVSVDLTDGDHTLAAHINNQQDSAGPGNPGPTCFVLACWSADAGNNPLVEILTTDDTWKGVFYPPTAPGMTPGEAMVHSLAENQAFGLLPGVSLSFDGEVDSNGVPWPIVGDITTRVGYDLQSFWCKELGAEYVDVRCAPGALVIDAYVIGTAGEVKDVTFTTPTDRTDPKSGQLTELAHDRTAKVATMALVRWLGGWHFVNKTPDGQRPKIKSLGLGNPPSQAQIDYVGAVQLELWGRERVAITAGYRAHTTADLPQHVAWVADQVTVPGWDGTGTLEQIISWTFVEDDHGTITWTPEIGDLLLDADQRAANALDKLSNGTGSGDSQVAQPISTIPTIGPTCCPPQPPGGGG